MKTRAFGLLAFVTVVSACSPAEDVEPKVDPAVVEMRAWRAAQTAQECPDVPQDDAARDLVRAAQDAGDVTHVYGEDDPYDRVSPVQDHLWTRPNPAGEGVIVTAVRGGAQVGLDEVSHSRHRAVWLVLDGTIYPLNVEASGSHGVLSSGLPVEVAERSGLSQHAINTESELGIEEFITFRWDGPGNPLPDCG